MDTSIVLKADERVFFNQVDNPLSSSDFSKVRDWITTNFGKVDIACFMCGAASEYPHHFIVIDQADEKRRIVESSLNKLIGCLELFDPTFYFSAGGTYLIPGLLSNLGKNIAQPSFLEISQKIKQLNLNVKPLTLEGGYSVDLSNFRSDSHILVKQELTPIESNIREAIRMHSNAPYDYEVLVAPSFEEIISALNEAQVNWLKQINIKALKITQSIRFEIYSELVIKSGSPDSTRRLGTYQLFQSEENLTGNLNIHIDQRALWGCLNRKFIWNGVLGSLCLFERTPNRFFPADFFSINYLTLAVNYPSN
jgi:hypothetical protein